MWYSKTDEKIMDKMEAYYERALKLQDYCNTKGRALTISYGSLNYLSKEIIFDRDYEEISFYVDVDDKLRAFFTIDAEMIENNSLYFKCDRKYFVLELGYKHKY